jgi:hypothetical protein
MRDYLLRGTAVITTANLIYFLNALILTPNQIANAPEIQIGLLKLQHVNQFMLPFSTALGLFATIWYFIAEPMVIEHLPGNSEKSGI